MKTLRNQNYWWKFEQLPLLLYLCKWLFLSVVSGVCIGSASALLLVSLEWATQYREHHLWIIALLPVAGLLIGLMYHYWAGTASRGNNYLIEEIRSPHDIIPFRMAPLVYIGTVLTHLFGGSAGREGTGVQMGGAIADQFSRLFRMRRRDHRLMVAIGISAGFASVFGTPLAGAVFGLEVIVVGRMRYEAILPGFLSAAVASMVCHAWGVEHTHYVVSEVPFPDASNLLWTIGAGILFGLAAMLFSRSIGFWSGMAKRISYPPFRPLIGGLVIAAAVWMIGTTKYIGLGVPTIVASFSEQQMWYDFLLKILFTTFTIGVGFKGGEVTPLLLRERSHNGRYTQTDIFRRSYHPDSCSNHQSSYQRTERGIADALGHS
jgi:H+/Cl- antiporter ClcA